VDPKTGLDAVKKILDATGNRTLTLGLRPLVNRYADYAIGNFPRSTSVRDMHVTFQIPYVCDYITQSCRQQAEVIQSHENDHVCYIEQGEAQHRKYKRLKLGGGHLHDWSSV
jgi:hypothetical protein